MTVGAAHGGTYAPVQSWNDREGSNWRRVPPCPGIGSRSPERPLGGHHVHHDEPTGALDSAAAAEIMDILAALNAEGMTLMLVTHDPRVAARTERVLYMDDGRIVGDRRQDRYAGTHLDQRQTELSQWLMAGEPIGAR